MNFPRLLSSGIVALALAATAGTARAEDDHHHGGHHGGGHHSYGHRGHYYGGHHGGHYYSDYGHHHGHFGLGIYAVPRAYYYDDYAYPTRRYYSSRRYAPARSYDAADDLAAEVQAALKRRGYYRGPIDGDVGAGSRAAIRAYQADRGLPVSGRITSSLLEALGIG